jgi:hypothetical protein
MNRSKNVSGYCLTFLLCDRKEHNKSSNCFRRIGNLRREKPEHRIPTWFLDLHVSSVKTLGISWTTTNDQFSFHYSPPEKEFVYTKRNIFRCTAMIFDPLGSLHFVGKVNDATSMGTRIELGWASPRGTSSNLETMVWRIDQVISITIPRCRRESIEIRHIEIRPFFDAFEKAYSTVVYTRHEYEDGGISVWLVAAKTRLAPLKTISVTRERL